MTHEPENPERDPVLDAAWREHSTEMPPTRLDAAILAAAHRASGSAPQPVVAQENGTRPADVGVKTRASTGPQRWWMPLAAAATIGAVALGIVQTMPQHESVIAPTVSEMPARAVERSTALQDTPRDTLQPKEKRDAPSTLAEADVVRAPPAAAPPAAPSAAAARKQAAKVAAPPATETMSPPATETVPPPATESTVPAPASLAAAPQPFPAERKADSGQSAESTDMKSRSRAALALEPTAAPPVAQFSGLARKDERQRSEPLQSARAAPAAMAVGKTAANSARPAKDNDVDAWIVRIHKLHDEGKLADAASELRALRLANPDADGRLPQELRTWAATVKP